MRGHLWLVCFMGSMVVIGSVTGSAVEAPSDTGQQPEATPAEDPGPSPVNTGEGGTDTEDAGLLPADPGGGATGEDTEHSQTDTGEGDTGEDTEHVAEDEHSNTDHGDDSHNNGTEHAHSVHVVAWAFDRVRTPLMLCLIILIAAILKVVFHYADWLSAIVPESCLLIIFGVIVGAVIHIDIHPADLTLDPDTFMLYLLPPIVLESAIDLNDRVVFENLGAILLYAILGTVLNCFLIGPCLYGLSLVGALGEIDINLIQCLLFASFIIAVDPVAVLAIFSDIGVNARLYFLVFGESLLNDAVTIVLYNMMMAFNLLDIISATDVLVGIASFFTVSLGALAIGMMYGLLSAIVTRFTSHVRITEVLAIFLLAYMAFLTAELFHWSGIISMIICGILQAQYALQNISRKSYITVKYFVKMLSSIADTTIFMFLGLELVRTQHLWHVGFILWALALCLVIRLLSTFSLSFILNFFSNDVQKIGYDEQFIMWYGGLRGAVSFALCATIHNDFEHKQLFMTATLVIIIVTVFGQGITIKPLVGLCGIERAEEKHRSVVAQFNLNVMDHIMSGMETIVGQMGDNRIRAYLYRINDQYLRRWLQSDPRTQDERLVDFYKKVSLKDHQRHIFEATSQTVSMGDDTSDAFVLNEDLDPEASKKAKTNARSRLFNLSRGDSTEDADMDDRQINAQLRWAFAKSAMSMMHQHDRNLTHENETDILDVLREKHSRIQENSRLRSPSQSRLQSRCNSVVSAHSQLAAITEVPSGQLEQMPNISRKMGHAMANGTVGKIPTIDKANGTVTRPRGNIMRSHQLEEPDDFAKNNTRRRGNQLNNDMEKSKQVYLKKNIDSNETFDNSSDPDQNNRETQQPFQSVQNVVSPDTYEGFENSAFVMGEHYQSLPRPIPRNAPQSMRSHSFTPGSLHHEHGFAARPRMYQPPMPHVYSPEGPYSFHPDVSEHIGRHPPYHPGHSGDMYGPMRRPYVPPPSFMYEPPYDYTGHPQIYAGPPPFYSNSPFPGYAHHSHTPQLRHRRADTTDEGVYSTGPAEMNSLPLLDIQATPSSAAKRFATVIHVGDATSGIHRRPSSSSTKL